MEIVVFQQALAAIDKNATPKGETKETSTAPQVASEISQNGVGEVASAC